MSRLCLLSYLDGAPRGDTLVNDVSVQSWVDAGQTLEGVDFWLEDDTGRALIKLEGDFEPIALLAAVAYGPYFDADERVRGKEAVIVPGQLIAVI